ncbi:hypothetical protein [Streptomyces sp. GS7]|uniref:hypothetical protein n=1 Tax=Streptomyces sp. GS7 TaxID=2692234 RepID=UPI001316860C|nr:hypothetical protein [Streptomyces sp. GS7]QHC26404.1 hypothetical protein GR130_38580 [Streptomyces sp. GS7]
MSDDYPFPEPFGPEYVRPKAADCPNCPCHTRRVCDEFQWHRAERPTYLDGTPYDKPCPCEEAAKVPEDRTVAIELDGVLRTVPARYHRAGLPAGGMVTERVFRAESIVAGECPVPVPMILGRPTDDTDPRLIVIDSAGERWVMGFTAQHYLQRYRITGWSAATDA